VLSLTIEKPAAGGRMLARADGLVVLVAGAIPGERVLALVERVGKGVAYADVAGVETPSTDRRLPSGDPACGGCLYAHVAYPRQLALKALIVADAFARIGRLELQDVVPVASSPEAGYRMRARFHVERGMAGFFREGSHTVCDARQTRQLLPATLDAVDRFVTAMRSVGLPEPRGLELAENVDSSERAVAVDTAARIDDALLERLAWADGFTGVVTPHGTRGSASVTDRLSLDGHAPVALRRHATAFFQGNRFLLDRLVAHVLSQVPPGGNLVDLYAGVGLFSVAAAAFRGCQVVAVEGDPVAAADLAANAATLGGAVVAVHQSVEEGLQSRLGSGGERFGKKRRQAWPFDGSSATVIVDPPRTGMSREALEGVLALRAPRVIYVSCDVATLARDARRLLDAGYALVRIDGFDLFPNTPHVETVAVLDRAAANGD
jgi:23S rRNA (uracil1939-C5)-methyltransferase